MGSALIDLKHMLSSRGVACTGPCRPDHTHPSPHYVTHIALEEMWRALVYTDHHYLTGSVRGSVIPYTLHTAVMEYTCPPSVYDAYMRNEDGK